MAGHRLWVMLWPACSMLLMLLTSVDGGGVGTGSSAGQGRIKRADDGDALQVTVGQLSEALNLMQSRLSSLEALHIQDKVQLQARLTSLESAQGKQVAFLAQSSADSVQANVPVPFSASLNIGHGFDSSQHVFVAPYPGVYLFTFQIFYKHGGDQLLIDLLQNTVVVVRMRVFDQVLETSEASAILVQAAAGDRFWLRPDHDAALYTGAHSFFSGALITPH